MKQKMSTADVAGEVACLRQRVLGMRLANIYDVNSKVRFVVRMDLAAVECAVALDMAALSKQLHHR